MKQAHLQRRTGGPEGIPGLLTADSLTLHTGEPPTLDVKPGLYTCVWDYSPHLGRTCYHLEDAQTGRTGIRIHAGNFFGDEAQGYSCDSAGCILTGMATDTMRNRAGNMQACILDSRKALEKLERWGNTDPFQLVILT